MMWNSYFREKAMRIACSGCDGECGYEAKMRCWKVMEIYNDMMSRYDPMLDGGDDDEDFESE